ncbi:hypothetical protein KAR91_67650, partial [Candidatus Pacearchaeota archaeon]|nr:hypothetical protein [Candidatus Pacearchaeota archaeon]
MIKRLIYILSFIVLSCNAQFNTPLLFNASLDVDSFPVNGLVFYFPFDKSLNDESGNGNNGTITGAVSDTSDRFDNDSSAYNFFGGKISIGNNAIIQDLPLSDFSILGWIRDDAIGASWGSVISGYSGGSGWIVRTKDFGAGTKRSVGISVSFSV